MGWEFTHLCAYLGAPFSISTTPTTHTPLLPPSNTTVVPLADYSFDPRSDTDDATASHSGPIEHPLVDPIMLSPSGTNIDALSESFVTLALDILELAI